MNLDRSETSMGQPEQPSHGIRVWAQEKGHGRVILSWEWTNVEAGNRDSDADARAGAATIGVLPGITSATPTDGGIAIEYDPEIATKQEIAAALRSGLTQEVDLKTRANALLKRAPAYANLARAMAMDSRVSPVPEAAKQAAISRANPMRSMPLRVIPGFPLIAQLHTLLPVLRSLSAWSREAPPEVVDEHLAAAGLDRAQIDRDLATAHEAAAFARAYASEKAALVASKATAAAMQARDAAQEWMRKRNEGSGSSNEPGGT